MEDHTLTAESQLELARRRTENREKLRGSIEVPEYCFGRHRDALLRAADIIGDQDRDIPPILPISEASLYQFVREGRFPKPLMIGPRSRAWRVRDIWLLANGYDWREAG